jgi:hypothetical protein
MPAVKVTSPCPPEVAFFLLKEQFGTMDSLFVLLTSSIRKNLSPLFLPRGKMETNQI